ncbi:MAG TPA: hypothetical protein VFI28_09995 [Candidatus Limnocylindrales bacterium]|nr:hypothetical protein [Candidatus Limnocylindrales bacterium]
MRRDRPWSAILVVLASVALVAVGVGGRLAGHPPATAPTLPSLPPTTEPTQIVFVPPSPSAAPTPVRTPFPAAYTLPALAHDRTATIDVLGRPGRTSGLWTQPLGPVPGGEVDLELVCAGPGSLQVGVLDGGPSTEDPCDGAIRLGELELPSHPANLYATSSGLAAWHVIARVGRMSPLPTPSSAIALAPGAPRPAAIGSFDEAITVVQLGSADGPSTGLLVRGLRPDGRTRDIATIAASAFPVDSEPELLEARAVASGRGYLAVPFARGDDSQSAFAAVFDLVDPSATATIVGNRISGFAWSPDGGLAVPSANGFDLYAPVNGSVVHVAAPEGVAVTGLGTGPGIVWTIANEIVARQTIGSRSQRGVLSLDGRFATGVPTIAFAPSGLERGVSADGRVATEGCDSSGPGVSGGCALVVEHEGHEDLVRWTGGLDPAPLTEPLWSAAGDALWLLADDQDSRGGPHHLVIARSATPTTSRVVARLTTFAPPDGSITIVGATGHDEILALDLAAGATMLVDTRTGRTVVTDGTFAGWADSREFVYPAAAR